MYKKNLFKLIFAVLLVLSFSGNIMAADIYNTPTPDTEYEPNPTPKIKMSSDGMYTLKANSEEDIIVTLKNVSAFYAYNILVQAQAEGENVPFKINFVEQSNIKYSLQNAVKFNVKMHITVDKNATDGTYPIKLTYNYSAKDKNGFSESDMIYLRIVNDIATPIVTLSDFKTDKEMVKAGESVKISTSLSNISEFDAKNLKVSLSGFEDSGLGLLGDSSTLFFKDYNSEYKNDISFNFITSKDMKSGSYPVNFNLKYSDKAGKEYENEFKFYIYVTDGKTTSDDKNVSLNVNIIQPEGVFKVGDVFEAKLNIKNIGKDEAENIKISAILPEGGEVVPRTASVTQIKSLKNGESKELSFSFSPTALSKTQNYSIGFNIEYETGAENSDGAVVKESFNQYTGANVSNPEGDKKDEDGGDDEKVSVPKIIISKYESNPLIVEAGKKFDLDMVFKNTNSEKSVENVKLFLTVEDETEEKGNVFSPDNASNTFYIDKIAPKGEVSHTFHMFTVPDAKARTYTIKVNFEYEDSEANPYTATELVGINVKQSAKLELGELNFPQFSSMGMPVNLSFELYNTGKVTLSNLMIKTEGNFDSTGSSLFIGNFEPGSSEYYEGVITPMEPGEATGKIIISYDDTNGEHIERVEEIGFIVEEVMEMGENFDDMPMESEETGIKAIIKKPIVWIISGVILVIAIIAGIFVAKKIKHKKELELNE